MNSETTELATSGRFPWLWNTTLLCTVVLASSTLAADYTYGFERQSNFIAFTALTIASGLCFKIHHAQTHSRSWFVLDRIYCVALLFSYAVVIMRLMWPVESFLGAPNEVFHRKLNQYGRWPFVLIFVTVALTLLFSSSARSSIAIWAAAAFNLVILGSMINRDCNLLVFCLS